MCKTRSKRINQEMRKKMIANTYKRLHVCQVLLSSCLHFADEKIKRLSNSLKVVKLA